MITSTDTIAEMNELFVGRKVRISHEGNPRLEDGEGICKQFHVTESGVDIELIDGRRWGFVPENLTPLWTEGPVGGFIAGRRKIELVDTGKSRIEDLEEATRRLHGLLTDPHPGLSTWQEALHRAGQELYDRLKAYVPNP